MRSSFAATPAMPALGRPGRAGSTIEILYGSLGPVALAALVTGLPIVFHLASQAAGIATCTLLALIVANFAAPTVPTVLLFSYVFQNLFVALVSPHIDSIDQLNSIRAYNFLLTAVIWVVLAASYWLKRSSVDRRMRLLMDVTMGALVLIGVYFVIGFAFNVGNAVVYLRNIAAPFLLLQIFAIVAYYHRVSVTSVLMLVGVFALIYGYLELFGQESLLRFVNGDVYINWRIKQDYADGVWLRDLQQTGRVMRSYLDTLQVDFLNTPLLGDLGLRFYRLVGPNFHSISFAYFLAVFGIMLSATGRWWYAVLVLPPILVIGSKGALVLLFLVIASLMLLHHVRGARRLWFYVAILAAYAAVGIAIGIQAKDYHVIGFIGGLRGFASNPIGHGIGAGGNLSLSVAAIDWSRSQSLGETDVAVESAIGVLLYQMGVAGIAVVGVLGWIVAKLWTAYRRTSDQLYAAGALGVLVITVNGIFQEEAMFAPLALGIMGAFAGLLLGTAYRAVPDRGDATRSGSHPPGDHETVLE
jgi:hypothetical protein